MDVKRVNPPPLNVLHYPDSDDVDLHGHQQPVQEH